MTLQQLRYLIAIAECGSISGAAHDLFVSQSSLSVALKEIETETGVTVFQRSNRGITITSEGIELLGYARQVVEQADLLEQRYQRGEDDVYQRLSVSTQHYTFCVEAFVNMVESLNADEYKFTLRETRTAEIIEDVSEFRSDIGVLYLDNFNNRVISKALDAANLTFTSLFKCKPHVFVGEHHPLANRKIVAVEDLADYARYSFEQGTNNSFYYSEEPLSSLPHKKRIVISDRGTLSNLLTHHNGYTVSTGVLSSEMHTGIASIPLKTDEEMNMGYVMHAQRKPNALVLRYIDALKDQIATYSIDNAMRPSDSIDL